MTDRTDFEAMLERRMRAYTATATHPVHAQQIARTTMSAAAAPVRPFSTASGGHRTAILIGLAAVLVLVVVAGAALVGRQRPVINGTFVAGPTLADGRIVDAVALPDGRIVVRVDPGEHALMTLNGTTVMRCNAPCRTRLALLDPRTGAFSPTHEQPSSMDVDSMALLADAHVLLIGGSRRNDAAPSATIYDPVADRFTPVGAPLRERSWPFVVTLADGRVLVGGGEADGQLATTELFDPATGTFTPAGELGRPRGIGATATRLADGRVLVVGGGAEVGTSAELFDPATGRFSPTGPMTVARSGFHSATLLPDGRVLFAGGVIPDAADPSRPVPTGSSQPIPVPTATAEIYDPTTGTFTAVGSMRSPRSLHAASILADGTVLVVGGAHDVLEGGPAPVADAEIFDPATGAFRPTGSLQQPRLWPSVVYTDERVLVLGDFDPVTSREGTGGTTEWFE